METDKERASRKEKKELINLDYYYFLVLYNLIIYNLVLNIAFVYPPNGRILLSQFSP